MAMMMLDAFQRRTLAERYLLLASANVNAALRLTADLVEAEDSSLFSEGAVTMSLAFHSVELFLKGAILTLRLGETFRGERHDIEKLERRYRNLFPAQAFRFDLPFRAEVAQLVEPDPVLERELTERLERLNERVPQDQFLRYPSDRSGVPWEDVHEMAMGYEPRVFLLTLQRLRQDYERIGNLLREMSAVRGKSHHEGDT